MINGSKREKSEEDRQTDGGIGWVKNIPRRRVGQGSGRGRRVGPTRSLLSVHGGRRAQTHDLL